MKSHKLPAFTFILIITSLICEACQASPTPSPTSILDTQPAPTFAPSLTPALLPEPSQTPTFTPTDTPQVTLETTRESPSIEAVITGLEGLPIDEFFDASYNQLLLRDPETITDLNLSAEFGMRNDQLTDISDAYLRETQQLESAILDMLHTYDREQLSAEQQLSYDIYEWYLDNRVRGQEFMYDNYPLNNFIYSYDMRLNTLFTELHPLRNQQDVEDYISRLSKVDDQVDQLLEGLSLREKAGVIPPDFINQMTRRNLRDYLHMRANNPATIIAESLPVYKVFHDSINQITALTSSERRAYLESASQEIEASFIPAYLKLIDYLDHLATIANDEAGVWKFPDGDAYYAYLLRQETSTDLTAEEIHAIGLKEIDRIKAEMRNVFDDLGYPQDESFSTSMDRVINESGYFNTTTQAGKDDYIAAIQALILESDQRIAGLFDLKPGWGVEVVGGPMGGYYMPGALDGSRPGAYHVNTEARGTVKYLEPTTAYHEAIPGHHYQVAIAQSLDLPLFRRNIQYNGYVEGWALYAERLAWEMGFYEDDPYGNIGRLQMELLRAVRLVTDTGIHAKGWTRQEAKAYMDETMGSESMWFSQEVDRYVVLPAQATSYKIGMLKMLELRQRAQDALGDNFDIKEFHNIMLGNGSMPLEILERLTNEYITTKLKQ